LGLEKKQKKQAPQQEQQQQLRRVVPVRAVLADAYEFHGLSDLARFVTLAVFASCVLYWHWSPTAPSFKAAVQGSFKAYGDPDWQGHQLAGVSTMMDGVEYAAGWLQLWIESSKEAGASDPGGARRAWAGSRGRGRLRRDPGMTPPRLRTNPEPLATLPPARRARPPQSLVSLQPHCGAQVPAQRHCGARGGERRVGVRADPRVCGRGLPIRGRQRQRRRRSGSPAEPRVAKKR
jgi:hypothetical protein